MSRDIDEITAGVREQFPLVTVSQLQVKFPGVDDDGIWYFALPGIKADIQIESSSGMCPFIMEHPGMRSSSEAWRANSIREAVTKIFVVFNNVGERLIARHLRHTFSRSPRFASAVRAFASSRLLIHFSPYRGA
jgi:hypothetical protein